MMRKILFALCAMATIASCSKSEIFDIDREAIAFINAFVLNGTRATDGFTIKTNDLLEFNVWATTQRPNSSEIVPILGGVAVSRTNASSEWGYDAANTQYWIPGNTYQFAAAKNYESVTLVNGVPSEFTYDAAAQLDLLYAANTRVGVASDNAAVAFTFEHLLSKAYFTIDTNLMSGDNANYTYRVSNICINNAVKEATYTVGGTWAGTANYTAQAPLTFGNVNSVKNSNEEYVASKLAADKTYTSDLARLLVPASYTALNITCTIETLYGDAVIDVQNYSKSIAQEFVKGYVYNFVLALSDPGQAIKFTVNPIPEWNTDINGNKEADDDISL